MARALTALDILPGDPTEAPPMVHALTHLDWTLAPLLWPLPSRLPRAAADRLAALWPQGRWVAKTEALSMGIPTPLRRLLTASTC